MKPEPVQGQQDLAGPVGPVTKKLINYIITPVLPKTPTSVVRQWSTTGNAVLHHAEGIMTRIGAETVTMGGVVEITQETTDHPKTATGGVMTNTIPVVDSEAETEAGAVARKIAEKRVKSALRCTSPRSSPLTTRFIDGREINLRNVKLGRQRKRG